MPIDYLKYPKNWKSEIRPAILERANNCCECCKVENHKWILRGKHSNGIDEIYQDDDGIIYNAGTSQKIGSGYVCDIDCGNNKFIKIVLTIAHLDHDTNNNDYANLKALCQRCHLRYDKDLHLANRKATIEKKKGLVSLFD